MPHRLNTEGVFAHGVFAYGHDGKGKGLGIRVRLCLPRQPSRRDLDTDGRIPAVNCRAIVAWSLRDRQTVVLPHGHVAHGCFHTGTYGKREEGWAGDWESKYE